ncbi:hypothetical protein GGI43DRAFT_225038 [Trichoderma evansii]
MPPFYNAGINETYRKNLSEPLQLPKSLSPAAKDILAKLLTREPELRLGFNGVSEIKAHPFFNDIDWEKLARRECIPPFKPQHSIALFKEERDPPPLDMNEVISWWPASLPDPEPDPKVPSRSSRLHKRKPTKNQLLQQQFIRKQRRILGRESHEEISEDPDLAQNFEEIPVKHNVWHIRGDPIPPVGSASHQRLLNPYIYPCPSIKDDDGWEIVGNENWELVWVNEDQAFHFYNRFTNRKEEITISDYRKRYNSIIHSSSRKLTGDSISDNTYNPALNQSPSQAAKHDALEAILKANYKHVVPQLLQNYGMDLNIYLFLPEVTPLYHETELEDVQLVKMFLDEGADPNTRRHGSAVA